MKNLFAVLLAAAPLCSAFAQGPVPGHFNCRYDTDASRGISAVRARLEINRAGRACLTFFNYFSGEAQVSGTSCGMFNTRYGTRTPRERVFAQRYDGFENYTAASHVSVPPSARRFGILELGGGLKPQFTIRHDRTVMPDATYVCEIL